LSIRNVMYNVCQKTWRILKMKTSGIFFLGAVCLICFWPSTPIYADWITIVNASFEDPVLPGNTTGTWGEWPGWSLFGDSPGSVWNINGSNSFWNTAAPDGNNVGYLAGTDAPGQTAEAFQSLGVNIQDNSIYNLSVFVGHPLGYGSTLGSQYIIQLWAANTVIASTIGTGPEGSFTEVQLSYDSTGSSYLGQELRIRLVSTREQTAFDALRLSVTSIPEPTNALFGLVLLGSLLRVRRPRLC
jgi:hypothetical protein